MRMAENIYIRLLKKMTKKKKIEKMNIKLSRKNLRALQTGLVKVEIVRDVMEIGNMKHVNIVDLDYSLHANVPAGTVKEIVCFCQGRKKNVCSLADN